MKGHNGYKILLQISPNRSCPEISEHYFKNYFYTLNDDYGLYLSSLFFKFLTWRTDFAGPNEVHFILQSVVIIISSHFFSLLSRTQNIFSIMRIMAPVKETLTSGLFSTLTYIRKSNTKRKDQTAYSSLTPSTSRKHFHKFNKPLHARYELRGKNKQKMKNHRKSMRLPFCSQNEKRDLYAMVIGQWSWNKLGDVENKCMEWWEDRKKETVGEKRRRGCWAERWRNGIFFFLGGWAVGYWELVFCTQQVIHQQGSGTMQHWGQNTWTTKWNGLLSSDNRKQLNKQEHTV